MARVLVLPDAPSLTDHVHPEVSVILAEEISPEHLESYEASQKFLDRLEWAVLDAHGVRKSYA